VVERSLKPAEAVKAYHDRLAKDGITPVVELAKDSEITEAALK
jgi:hypothetical protein